MIPSRVQAHIVLSIKWLPAAGTQELNLDRPGVRLVVVGVTLLRDRILREAHVQGLQGVGPCRARRGVTVAPAAVRGENGAQFKVCGRFLCQSWLSRSSAGGRDLRFSCCRMYPQYVYPIPHVGAVALETLAIDAGSPIMCGLSLACTSATGTMRRETEGFIFVAI